MAYTVCHTLYTVCHTVQYSEVDGVHYPAVQGVSNAAGLYSVKQPAPVRETACLPE